MILSLIQFQPLPQLVSTSPISLSCYGGISFSSQTGRQFSEEPQTALRKREDNVQQKVNERLGLYEMINKSWRSFESCPIYFLKASLYKSPVPNLANYSLLITRVAVLPGG